MSVCVCVRFRTDTLLPMRSVSLPRVNTEANPLVKFVFYHHCMSITEADTHSRLACLQHTHTHALTLRPAKEQGSEVNDCGNAEVSQRETVTVLTNWPVT